MRDSERRRLSAIVAVDMAGFSRMMSADEIGTVVLLRALWGEVLHPAVARHGGRVVKMMGDGALVEFVSVIDAVECSVGIQRAMIDRNHKATQPVALRIGINLSEIIVDGEDILGDGVNIAARLESQAPVGGILISGIVHSQVQGKVSISFEDAGDLQLKNIPQPVRGWVWQKDKQDGKPDAPAPPFPQTPSALLRPSVVDIPSLAVLPFAVISQDEEQACFADGLVDDILTRLSKLSGLRVIARHSSFAYKGSSPDVDQIAKQLGVRHLLQGSVRRAGNRMRITTQLVDAASGTQVWAERYDRDMDDIFAVQDEISLQLVTELQVHLTEGEQARLRYTTTTNVAAWNCWIEGLTHHNGPMTATSQIRARKAWERGLALDPGSATLYALLGHLHLLSARFGWWDDSRSCGLKAQALTEKALSLDPDSPDAYRNVSNLKLGLRDFEGAATAARRLVELSPNAADALVTASYVLQSAGSTVQSIDLMERALLACPNFPSYYLGVLGNAYRLAGRLDEALAAFRAYHQRSNGFGLADIVMIQEQAGHVEDARRTAAELLSVRPDFTISAWVRTQFRADEAQLARDRESLRASQLPE